MMVSIRTTITRMDKAAEEDSSINIEDLHRINTNQAQEDITICLRINSTTSLRINSTQAEDLLLIMDPGNKIQTKVMVRRQIRITLNIMLDLHLIMDPDN